MPKIINIFLQVIDNLGDIGFACEIVRTFHEASPGKYSFDIWTNSVEKVKTFFEKNPELSDVYNIRNIEQIREKKAHISLLLFHHSIPENYPYTDRELFLRIDYLSFDEEWIKHHGIEHIHSTENKKIIEIIPSPLYSGGGIISPPKNLFSRHTIAEKFGLALEKKWICIFAYKETLLLNFKIESLENAQILLLGNDPALTQDDKKIIYLPLLSLKEFSSIIHESAWSIIRGEVSFITTLTLGKPFFGEMYKEIGGYNHEQARQFLYWCGGDEKYRDIFHRLNGQKSGIVKVSEIDAHFRKNPVKRKNEYKNLREELEKYIDKYYISL